MVLSYRARESRVLAAMDDEDVMELYDEANAMSGRGFKSSLKKFGRKVSRGSRKVARAVKTVAKNPLVSALVRDVYNDSIKGNLQSIGDAVIGESNRKRVEALGRAGINAAKSGKRIDRAIGRAAKDLVEKEVLSGNLGAAIQEVAGETFKPVSSALDKNKEIIQLVAQLRKSGYDDVAVRQYLADRGLLNTGNGFARRRYRR